MFSLHRCVSCISPHVAVAELVARPREGLLRAALATVRARKRLLTRVDLGRLLSHKVHSTGVLHTSQSLSSTFDLCLTGFFYSTLAWVLYKGESIGIDETGFRTGQIPDAQPTVQGHTVHKCKNTQGMHNTTQVKYLKLVL